MTKPAILGGDPAFPDRLALMRPQVPSPQELAPALEEIHTTGKISNFGPYALRLEEALAARLRVKHCLTLSNLSTGLMYMPRAAGLLEGEVIVPSFTFMATAHSMWLGGLSPVFADIDPDTLTLDPVSVEAAIGPHTVAVCAVHIYGTPCDIEGLQELCRRRGLVLLFDSAHGLGSTYKGRPLGGFGTAEGYSTSSTKIFSTLGEGGFLCTDDDGFAENVRLARNWGNGGDYDPQFASLGAKMPEIAAAAGLIEIQRLDGYLESRRKSAAILKERLGAVAGIRLPVIPEGCESGHKDFPVLVDPDSFGLDSFSLAEALDAEGIETRKYFHPCLHVSAAYRGRKESRRVPLEVSERAAEQVLCLPFFNFMAEDTLHRMCDAIQSVQSHARQIQES